MKNDQIHIDDYQEKSYKEVFIKFPKKKTCLLPQIAPIYKCELLKKGKIMKNRRFFQFYNDKCIFFKKKECLQATAVAFYDFDLRVEWLFNPCVEHPFSRPYGFKLYRGNDISEILFIDELTFNDLRPILSNSLNQCNFHKHFKAVKKIGQGNFANVYLVNSLEDNSSHAVKSFCKEEVYKEEFGKESLRNEIEIMRKFNHVNLMKLEEVYETENSIYMVLELLEGGNLYHQIKKNGIFSESETKYFMSAILKGIMCLHENGIIHRDIKPENILFRSKNITEAGICIGDFGLSTFKNLPHFLFARCGTPGFVAPEVINISDLQSTYKEFCDEFSCGLVFHIMLIGRSLFTGKTYNEILNENRKCEFNWNDPVYNKLSPDAKDLMMRLLHLNPEKRITCKEALNHGFFKENILRELKSPLLPIKISKETTPEYHSIHSLTIGEHNDKTTLEKQINAFNQRKFEIKNISDLNTTARKISEEPKITEDDSKKNVNDQKLVSREPCYNGFIESSLRMDDEKDNSILLKKNIDLNDHMSPLLKENLKKNAGLKLKLSTFGKNDKDEEEKQI